MPSDESVPEAVVSAVDEIPAELVSTPEEASDMAAICEMLGIPLTVIDVPGPAGEERASEVPEAVTDVMSTVKNTFQFSPEDIVVVTDRSTGLTYVDVPGTMSPAEVTALLDAMGLNLLAVQESQSLPPRPVA